LTGPTEKGSTVIEIISIPCRSSGLPGSGGVRGSNPLSSTLNVRLGRTVRVTATFSRRQPPSRTRRSPAGRGRAGPRWWTGAPGTTPGIAALHDLPRSGRPSHGKGWIQLDAKDFMHNVRQYRNFVHPRAELEKQPQFDRDIVTLCWRRYGLYLMTSSSMLSQQFRPHDSDLTHRCWLRPLLRRGRHALRIDNFVDCAVCAYCCRRRSSCIH
jgi:hypothetical protein